MTMPEELSQRAQVAMHGDRRMRVTRHELAWLSEAFPVMHGRQEPGAAPPWASDAWGGGLDLIVVPECFRCVRPARDGHLLCERCLGNA